MTATRSIGILPLVSFRWRALGLVTLLAGAYTGIAACSKGEDVVAKSAESSSVGAEDPRRPTLDLARIDADPLVLLPAGELAIASLDVSKAWGKPVGERLGSLIEAHLPLPPSAGFVPRRDLERLTVGFYNLRYTDAAGVAQGRFDVDAIDAAADGTQLTARGKPLLRVSYAGRVFYVSGDVGFAILTPKTALFGNESGLRRALDRVSSGGLSVTLEPMLDGFLKQPGAPLKVGVNQKGAESLRAQFPRQQPLAGLQLARILGDFRAPGLQFAGSLTYGEPSQAQQSARYVNGLGQNAAWLSTLGGFLGYGSLQISSVQSQASVQVTGQMDDALAARLIDQALNGRRARVSSLPPDGTPVRVMTNPKSTSQPPIIPAPASTVAPATTAVPQAMPAPPATVPEVRP